MDAKVLLNACEKDGIDLFTGVPDSQLAGLCDTLYARYGTKSDRHVVTANEGNAIAMAAGHYLATGKPALVYMQNSGLGNAVNPLASLMDGEVYALPCLMVIGWRGEPGVKDEPQHVTQGRITLGQLELMGVRAFILGKETDESAFAQLWQGIQAELRQGRCAALVVRKGALTGTEKPHYGKDGAFLREEAAAVLADVMEPGDIVVSTTGKLSRELFEIRERRGEGHEKDFLTVGSMGHASSIALGIALAKKNRRVWCLDGDGAALMHLGAMAVIGQKKPDNLVHVIINNGAHETVGGMPVCSGEMDIQAQAKAAGYPHVDMAADAGELRRAAHSAMTAGQLCLIEVRCALGARSDLGRPTTTPKENRDAFMAYVQAEEI